MSLTYSSNAVTVTVTGATIATTGVSASVTIPNDSSGNLPSYIRVVATAAACVRMGRTTATAVTTDTQIQPGDALIMQVPKGYDKIAAIQVTASGIVQISPLENS